MNSPTFKKIAPLFTVLSALATIPAFAADLNADLTQLQHALAVNPDDPALLNDPNIVKKLNELAETYRAQGNYSQAEVLYQRALAIREKTLSSDHPNLAASLNNLAEVYRAQGKYAQALPLFQHGLSIYETALGKAHPFVATSLNNIAAVYYATGKYAAAEPLYLRSLAIDENSVGKNHPDVAVDLSNLGVLYQAQGKYNAAETVLLRSLAIRETALGKNHPEVAMSLNSLGSLYRAQGKFADAEALLKRSVSLVEQALGKNHPDVASNVSALAAVYFDQRRYEQAEPLYLRAVEICEKNPEQDNPAVAKSLNNLGILYYAQGKYPQALPLLQQSLALREKVFGKNHPEVAESLNNLAMLYQAQDRYADAEPLLQQSLAIDESIFGKNHPSVATDLNNLGVLYQKLGKYSQAEPLQEQSLAMREQTLGQNHPDVAIALNNLAALYDLEGKSALAQALYQRSLAISEPLFGKNYPSIATVLNNLALSYAAENNTAQVLPLLQKSLRISNQALNHWLWGAGEKTRAAYLQQQEFMKSYYLSFYALSNQAEEALYFSLSRKGLLLRIASEVSALEKHSANPQLQKQLQQFNALKAQFSTLALSGKAEKSQLQSLEDKINAQEMQLTQQVSKLKHTKTDVLPAEVLQKLSPQQVLVDFLIYKEADFKTQQYKSEQLIAIVASKNSGIKLVKLGELEAISDAIKTYRHNVMPTAQGQLAHRETVLTPASQQLYAALWQPLLPYLADKKEVFLIPDGILHLLPFKVLQDKQGHYLAENQQITVLTSARDLVLPPLSGKTTDAVIFAAPVYGEQGEKAQTQPTRNIATRQQELYFSPLEGAAAEGKALSALIKTKQRLQLFQGLQATESQVSAIQSPRLLHFATHGFFLENLPQAPAKAERAVLIQQVAENNAQTTENPLTHTGLALSGANFGINGKTQADGSDGILTALEVLGLNLTGTKLVTLSACETGVGEIRIGEGVYSLNRAFQEAGAKSVLSTLWSVADEQTKMFMQDFYAAVLSGLSPQQALQKTQLKFIQNKAIQDPFFWAAFTVVGK